MYLFIKIIHTCMGDFLAVNVWVTTLPSFLGVLLNAVAAVITFFLYRRTNFRELLVISFGWLLASIFASQFFIFSFVQGIEYEQLRLAFNIACYNLSFIGFYIIWFQLIRLSGKGFDMIEVIVSFIFFGGMGAFSVSVRVAWQDGWLITYEPTYGIALGALGLLLIQFHLLNLTYETISKGNRSLPYWLIWMTWLLFLSAGFVLVAERTLLTNSPGYYLIINAIASLTFTLGVFLDPFSIMPRTIGLRNFLILDKTDGSVMFDFVPRKEIGLLDVEKTRVINELMGILHTVTGSKDVRELRYADLSLLVLERADILGLVVSDRSIPLLKICSEDLLDLFKHQGTLSGAEVRQALAFAM